MRFSQDHFTLVIVAHAGGPDDEDEDDDDQDGTSSSGGSALESTVEGAKVRSTVPFMPCQTENCPQCLACVE